MSSILSAISSLVTSAASWLGSWAQLIVGYTPATESASASWNPGLLSLFVLLPLVGLGIGLLNRLRR